MCPFHLPQRWTGAQRVPQSLHPGHTDGRESFRGLIESLREFSAELGRRFTVTYASPSVTTNLTGGLLVQSGAVAGTVTSADPYAITFEMSGGTMAVYVGGELAGESSGTGEQSIRFIVASAADEVRFVYTPEAGSVAVLKKVSGARGSSISIR